MDILWEEKSDYKLLDSKRYHINETCGRSDLFIPYERKYSTLNEEQLLCLICAAKQNRWQALDLTSCGLTWLPDELWDLPDLQMLFLGNRERHNRNEQGRFNDTTNMISVLSRNIEALKNLRVLSLAGNSITIEGESTLNLPRLRHLDIFDCDLPQVPNALLIPSLEEIGFNCLEEHLADNFANLRKLKRIYLSHSKIVDLPEYIGTFYSLQHLYLFGSTVSSLPNAIGQLRHLSRIEMYNTPLAEALPPEILKQSAREIIRYVLSQQSNAQKEFFNESKMVIVGQGHVGKSSLLNRLINNSYLDGGSTEGIDISSWFFTQDGQPYRLNVWDFGGQEIYHSTHQFFLTKRSLYLLVWDALAEVEYGRIDYWLKTIQSLAADSPIIIVVNKCDRGIGRIGRIDAGDYMDRYPQIKEVVYVSCKDNIGITELRSTIQSLAVDLPLMKTSWLSSWMAVRNHLEVLSKKINFIPYTEYLGICKAEGIEVDEAKSLIKYLHDLGIVLYYHDDPLLKNLVILSSEWGTDAVYKVLDEQERQLKGRNGILYYDDLPLIWNDDNRYPQDRYPYLLNLMKKFQLAFEITPSSFLVAELLDNKIINCDRNFPFGETLSFRYQYDFIPAGIMTRFIVASNRYLDTDNGVKLCWKKGAYLNHRTAYALVRLHDYLAERYVEIRVSGEHPRDRQELLTIIRSTFDDINGQFSRIQIIEQIPCICSSNCNFLFDYKKLLKAEEKGKLEVQCHDTFENVDIKKLLDGVELQMESKNYAPSYTTIISPQINPQMTQQFNPVNTITASSAADSASTNTVTITIEIRDLINGLHGDLNDLKEEVGNTPEEFTAQCEKVEKALEKLDNCNTKEDVTKSGAMKKIERFLKECNDPESETGKILAGIKYAAGIIKDLAGKYNKIAKWVALPQLPFGN